MFLKSSSELIVDAIDVPGPDSQHDVAGPCVSLQCGSRMVKVSDKMSGTPQTVHTLHQLTREVCLFCAKGLSGSKDGKDEYPVGSSQ